MAWRNVETKRSVVGVGLSGKGANRDFESGKGWMRRRAERARDEMRMHASLRKAVGEID